MSTRPLPFGSNATMASRAAGTADDLDFFPTPPWAVRAALPFLHQLDPRLDSRTGWDPCCGELHMAAPLAEVFGRVVATDVHDYSGGRADFSHGVAPGWLGVLDFGALPERATPCWARIGPAPDWIVTNPPFNRALEFAEIALELAVVGVAFLVRTQWLEGGERSGRCAFFKRRRPRLILQYAERVPMHRGRWEPEGSTAAAYCWVVWLNDREVTRTEFDWIEPGQRARLTRREDLARFARPAPAGLGLEAGA